jgi:hypothetical protein
MQPSAWAFMLGVWAIIIGSTAYCFWRLLSSDRKIDGDDAGN